MNLEGSDATAGQAVGLRATHYVMGANVSYWPQQQARVIVLASAFRADDEQPKTKLGEH